MFETIFEKIKEYPVITIFRHTEPDMDALGSQDGLKKALKYLFPEKEILALGAQTRNGYVMDQADDETVQNSFGILLDTANAERIDDQRFLTAAEKARFDHHVKVEDFGDLDYVDTTAGATAQVLSDFFRAVNQDIGSEAAQQLYQALSADTAKFTTNNTTPESLEAGAWLLRQGANVVRTDTVNSGISLNDFRYGGLVRHKATVQNRLIFAVMSKTDWMTNGLEVEIAAKKAFMLAGIRDIDIWALFTEDSDGFFFASLRSRTREVRDIAVEYGGGGHFSAAGIKGLKASEVCDIIKKLSARSIETDEARELREQKQKEAEAEKEEAEKAEAEKAEAENTELQKEEKAEKEVKAENEAEESDPAEKTNTPANTGSEPDGNVQNE